MRKLFKQGIAAVMVAAMTLSGVIMADGNLKKVQAADEYKLVWEDEFEGESLDRSKWIVEVNGDGGGNNELQYYVDSTDNISVSDGALKITAKKQNYNGKKYTSGRINSMGLAQFKYGKIEARMKLPSFQGAWPAFWMLGANYSQGENVGWPRCGEIDIMEAINTEPFTHSTLHWFYDQGNIQADNGLSSEGKLPADFDRTDWHIYGMEWNSQTMKFYVDGIVYFEQDISASHMSEFRAEQFIIFNLAIGGNWPGFDIDDSKIPASMLVDYVRVYQKDSDKGSHSGDSFIKDYEGPTKTEHDKNVVSDLGKWNFYYDYGNQWAYSNGSGKSSDSSGFTMNITKAGTQPWGIQSSLQGLKYDRGKTYRYSFTMTSTMDKNVIVKVVGRDSEANIFSMENIHLEANKPYTYTKEVTIPLYYRGPLNLFFGFGAGVGAENIKSDSAMQIKAENISFVGDLTTPLETETEPATTTNNTPDSKTESSTASETDVTYPTEEITTTGNKASSDSKIKKPAKAKIKSVKRSKNNKNITIRIRKMSKVKGYQIKYSTSKKFKKNKTKYANTKKTTKVIKKLKKESKYYVKVRAYRVVNNKKRYGKWSTKKVVRVCKRSK